jgi:ssDNA-binding Zn-finger/Zn-ribbon topoisomerase 1
MATGIDRFTKSQFEDALTVSIADTWTVQPMGMMDGQEVYYIDITSPHCGLLVFSSIDSTGRARASAEDSIRAVIAQKKGKTFEMLGGKVQNYVTRRKNWRMHLANMLNQMVRLAQWIQPCPVCKKMLRLKVAKKKGQVYLFCPEDSENRDNADYDRHLALHVLDFETGGLVEHLFLDANDGERKETPKAKEPEHRCPVCGGPTKPMIGKNAGKGVNCAKSTWTGKKMEQPCGPASTIWFDKK